MKKTIATLLTLVMLVCAFSSSFSAFAAEYTVDEIIEKYGLEEALEGYDVEEIITQEELDQLLEEYDVDTETQYTVDDIINKASESEIYHHIEGDVQNLAKSVELTNHQINLLYDVAERFVALELEDKGETAHHYTDDEKTSVIALVEEACDILKYKYEFVHSTEMGHENDIIFNVYTEDNTPVYSFDGDAVNKTGTDDSILFVTVIAAGCALLAAAVAVAVKTKKKAI